MFDRIIRHSRNQNRCIVRQIWINEALHVLNHAMKITVLEYLLQCWVFGVESRVRASGQCSNNVIILDAVTASRMQQ